MASNLLTSDGHEVKKHGEKRSLIFVEQCRSKMLQGRLWIVLQEIASKKLKTQRAKQGSGPPQTTLRDWDVAASVLV